MARISVILIIGASLLTSIFLIMPNLKVTGAESTAMIETQFFSDSWSIPPRKVKGVAYDLPSGTKLRIIFNASDSIDFFCQNFWEYNQSSYNDWLNVSAHWSRKAASMNETYTIPTRDWWYFTLANYDAYNPVDVYTIKLYRIDTYEIHVESGKANYNMTEQATTTATVHKNDRPATGLTVNIQVSNPSGTVILSQNKSTNAQGQITLAFQLPHVDGQYCITAKATISEIAIEDSAFFTITKDATPPITFDNYNGSWLTADFTITLTPTDNETGVSETYYRINNDPTLNVSANGQPRITTESANNTLEYWSVDNTGNEEIPHKILSDIKLDKTAPKGSVLISANATYTNSTTVNLTLVANDTTSGVSQVRVSNDGLWSAEQWESPQSNKTWNLTLSDGIKTVYYQIKDNAGLVSDMYSDTIILDTKGPIGSVMINGGAVYANSTSVTLTLSAMDTMSGVAKMRFSNDNTSYTEWQAYGISKPWKLSDENGMKAVYVQFMDHVGLVSTYSATVVLDTVQPTGSITVNGGAAHTNSTVVTLTLSANDATSGIAQIRFSNDNLVWSSWETYASSRIWTLPSGDGVKSVLVQYRDNANLTVTCSDTIILDRMKPTASAGTNQTVYEGMRVTLDASASKDENGIATYTWTFIDVTTRILKGKEPTYTFGTQGVYAITLEVTDPAGNLAVDTTSVAVLKMTKPIANAGQNRTASLGTAVAFDARASTDRIGIVSYHWDFGDGTGGAGETTTHAYANPGTYTVTLTVTNALGSIDMHQITILVVPSGTPAWMIGTIIGIALVTTILVTLVWKKRKDRSHSLFRSKV